MSRAKRQREKRKGFKTTHGLAFEVAPYVNKLAKVFGMQEEVAADKWIQFRIGTCEGLWRSTDDAYEILTVLNREIGNGHFEDVLEWFEHSAKRDHRALRIRELMSDRFRDYLISKRGFVLETETDVIKRYQ